MGVMLQRDKQSQRLYLHDVVAISKKETTKVGEVTPITTETATLNDSLYMTSILLKAYNVKEKTTYPNAKYSKDDTIFDDFEDEEVMFTDDGDIAFDGFGADDPKVLEGFTSAQQRIRSQWRAKHTSVNRTTEERDAFLHELEAAFAGI